MKNHLLLLLTMLIMQVAAGQKNPEGIWEGKLNAGPTVLRLVLHIQKDNEGYHTTMDSPDQGATGIPTGSTLVKGDSIIIEVPGIHGSFEGVLQTDTTLDGQWKQGMSIPLAFKKVKVATAINRPQEPKPPFSYNTEDIIYFNKDKTIQYGATLTTPKSGGPFTTVILITGSGQENRDEELFGHKPFLVIADYLTKQGYAVLRVDDRGIGQTTGDVRSATTKDFAGDVEAGIDYLKTMKKINKQKIGLVGHSEGGMIAQLVSAKRSDVAFVISLAGPGEKTIDLMSEQTSAILLSMGTSKKAIDSYRPFYRQLVQAILNASNDTVAKAVALEKMNTWLLTVTADVRKELFTDEKEETRAAYVDGFLKQVRSPWFSYFITYDPAPFIKKMKGKVFVINGEKDIQVPSKSNLAGWKAALQKSSVKTYQLIELKGLNHLFQHCTTCTTVEYGTLEETFAPEALSAISNWLKKI